MRVLIVDDDRIICHCLKKEINWEKLGCHEIEVCYDGEQALECIQERKPNIIISDVKMSALDGKQLCKMVYEKFSDISFIFLSGYEDFFTAQLALRYHVKGYILKPLDRKSLSELEELIGDIVLQRESSEFIRKIVRDEYRDYLEGILKQKDTEGLQQFFGRISEFHEQSQFWQEEVYMHLLQPLFGYRYRNNPQNTGHLFQIERRIEGLLEEMNETIRISYIEQQYMEEIMKEEKQEEENELIRQIQNVVKDNFHQSDFNVYMLGQLLHMSPTYLGRVFMEETGVKLVDYITQQRLEKACELLSKTKKTVREIAELVGYADVNYFTKVFFRKKQMKPLEYRYEKREKNEK